MTTILKKILFVLFTIFFITQAHSQKLSIAQMKKELDTTRDPIGYVKYRLKKKYFIDSVSVISTMNFLGKADSLAYKGKLGKTYGPFPKENILVKILAKAPTTFYHVKHILLDTSTFTPKFATGLADSIISRIQSGKASFASQASTYSSDVESSAKGGDLGWFVRGVMLKEIDMQLTKKKKGDLFKVWSPMGLHIIYLPDNPKEDTGYGLLLRVIL